MNICSMALMIQLLLHLLFCMSNYSFTFDKSGEKFEAWFGERIDSIASNSFFPYDYVIYLKTF